MNFEEKQIDPGFIGDMEALLRAGIRYNHNKASEWVINELIENI